MGSCLCIYAPLILGLFPKSVTPQKRSHYIYSSSNKGSYIADKSQLLWTSEWPSWMLKKVTWQSQIEKKKEKKFTTLINISMTLHTLDMCWISLNKCWISLNKPSKNSWNSVAGDLALGSQARACGWRRTKGQLAGHWTGVCVWLYHTWILKSAVSHITSKGSLFAQLSLKTWHLW